MNILKKLSTLFTPQEKVDRSALWIVARCARCGEIIRTRVNLNNDLSQNYDENEGKNSFFAHKTLMGDQGCFQRIEVELTFDGQRKLVSKEISGGAFVEE